MFLVYQLLRKLHMINNFRDYPEKNEVQYPALIIHKIQETKRIHQPFPDFFCGPFYQWSEYNYKHILWESDVSDIRPSHRETLSHLCETLMEKHWTDTSYNENRSCDREIFIKQIAVIMLLQYILFCWNQSQSLWHTWLSYSEWLLLFFS